ncbi:hypothetical protein SAMD00019534_116220, partial [Acytostelium subglobosum LB1]|uniref:hypothetical protein n=1 Tax=Acytostelium subglobosum LB1 TaxID=1410327 RepID=UPI000644CF16
LIYRIAGSFALLSFLGALFVIITFGLFKDLQKYPTKLVFLSSLCDLIFSFKYMVTSVIPNSQYIQNTEIGCYVQAGFQQFFGLAAISWSGMISFNLILTTANPFKGNLNPSAMARLYHLWVWGLSATTTVFLGVNYRMIGPSGDGTCWVADQQSPMRLTFYIPLLLYFCLSLGSLIAVIYYSAYDDAGAKEGGATARASRNGMRLRMCIFTAVFILCWLGDVVHRTAQWLGLSNNDINNPSLLMYFDVAGVSIQGFMNSLVWLTNPRFVNMLRPYLGRFIPCIGIKADENTPLLDTLGDVDQDPNRLATIIRVNTLKCVLRGISVSVQDNIKISNQEFSEGKSGSYMCFTHDNKYLIKTITKEESQLLKSNIVKFYQHYDTYRSSLLLMFYGCHKVVMPHGPSQYFVVVSNVFSTCTQRIQNRFDIKGSSINRGGNKRYDPSKLGLDLDFLNTRRQLPAPINLRQDILDQLEQDSKFLESLNIMDYSLLIGIHQNGGGRATTTDSDQVVEINDSLGRFTSRSNIDAAAGDDQSELQEVYYIGIIDTLQMYNFSKKQERFLKVYLTRKNATEISAAPPSFYQERFMKRMRQIIHTPSDTNSITYSNSNSNANANDPKDEDYDDVIIHVAPA